MIPFLIPGRAGESRGPGDIRNEGERSGEYASCHERSARCAIVVNSEEPCPNGLIIENALRREADKPRSPVLR